MEPSFTADFFVANRQHLRRELKLSGDELAIVPAHSKLQKTHDEAYKFYQDNNFFYLTGIREPDCVLVITAKYEMLLSPLIKAHHQLWEGQSGVELMQQTSGIADILTGSDGWNLLRGLLAGSERVHIPLPYNGRVLKNYYRMVANPARASLIRKLKGFKPIINIEDLRPMLSSLRMVKQSPELEAIKQAIAITLASIEVVAGALPTLRTEQEAQALLEYEFLRRGAEGPGFDSIIASGANTTQIHYMQSQQAPLDKGLVLIDVGAQVHGYKADVSRVFSQNGFTPRQQQIYDAVQELQEYAFSLLKPGANLMDYEDMMEQKTTELTADLRLAKHRTAKRGMRVTPHAVSHHLGLDAHDPADYKAALQPGMVLAVEPGIYLPEEGIGIRIEDDVLITNAGVEILSRDLPQASS